MSSSIKGIVAIILTIVGKNINSAEKIFIEKTHTCE